MPENYNPPSFVQNRYRLVEWLGRGSMGVVYRAYDETLGRDVAIKFLPPEKLAEVEMEARFAREARAIARLSHPNIITIYDVGEDTTSDTSWHYLVLEYVPGTNINLRMQQRGGSLPLAEALEMIRAVLNALAYAHAQGVIHRDLKPENIMVTPEGRIKVSDFGLALYGKAVRLTQEGALVGTALYMAPEMVRGDTVDHRADLFAVGAVLYETLTGQPPFSGDDIVTIISRIIHAPVPPLNEHNLEIPPELDTIVSRLLAKNPDERYPSAGDVLNALEKVLDEPVDNQERLPVGLSDASASLLERIVRSSGVARMPSEETSRLEKDDEPLLELVDEIETDLTQALLLYAATEDVADAVEAERRHLARLVLQHVVEPLNLLLSQARTYEQTLASNPTARMAVSVLTTLARQVLQQTRDLEAHLHPVMLDSLGLEPALEMLANQGARSYGIQIQLEIERLQERLPAPVELAIFRAAQALLEWASRQGQASLASVRLGRNAEELVFEWREYTGRSVSEDPLHAVRRRIEQLGGQVRVSSDAQEGFKVIIHFKLNPPVQLTDREMEVIQRLIEGYSNKDIARSLVISPRTVNFHLDNIYAKLGVRTRTEAAIYAIRQGWARRKP